MTKAQNLDFSSKNRVSPALLRKVQDLSYTASLFVPSQDKRLRKNFEEILRSKIFRDFLEKYKNVQAVDTVRIVSFRSPVINSM